MDAPFQLARRTRIARDIPVDRARGKIGDARRLSSMSELAAKTDDQRCRPDIIELPGDLVLELPDPPLPQFKEDDDDDGESP
jgi:hypothetical protein